MCKNKIMISNEVLHKKIVKLKTFRSKWLAEAHKYKKAYELLIEYCDSIPDEDKEYVAAELIKLGL